MARSRNIEPAICLNDVLAGLAHWVRLMFIYLWTIADRAGRLRDNPRRIGAALFPYEPGLPFDEGLQQLHEAGFIRRYVVHGDRLIQVVNWARHQNPHPKEAESELPAETSNEPAGEKPRPVTAFPLQAPERPEPAPEKPERAVLIPSSLIPDSRIPSPHGSASEEPGTGLQEFLAAYPKRTKGDAAARAYISTIETEQEHLDLMAGLSRWLNSDQWRRSLEADGGRYIPDPDKFLFDRRFTDHPAPYQDASDSGGDAVRAALAILKREAA
ncbi:MAG: phage replication protein [Bryobacteraceae bacterium]|jgi:hypothetical protein